MELTSQNLIILMPIVIYILHITGLIYKFRQMSSSYLTSGLVESVDALYGHLKKEVYTENLKKIVSAHPELRAKKQFRCLEIGCGSGAILPYYPPGTRLVLEDVDTKFEPRLRARLAKYPEVHIDQVVFQPAENLSLIPSNSMDAVVSSYVMCSVHDPAQCMSEIKRVLVPDGKYIFMEHVTADKGTFAWCFQKFLMLSGLWPFFSCGCNVDRHTGNTIKDAGFSSCEFQRADFNIFSWSHLQLAFVTYSIHTQVYGVATK